MSITFKIKENLFIDYLLRPSSLGVYLNVSDFTKHTCALCIMEL